MIASLPPHDAPVSEHQTGEECQIDDASVLGRAAFAWQWVGWLAKHTRVLMSTDPIRRGLRPD